MGRVARARLAELAREWVETTCAEQGVAVHVEDVATVDAIADLLHADAEEVA